MRAQRKIDVEQAEIRTATVEIKSMMVSARKMTLSVFRQIPEQDLLILDGDTVTLAGVPWGQVNYYWGDQDASGLHILWQQGRELKRSIVDSIDDLRNYRGSWYGGAAIVRDVYNDSAQDIAKYELIDKAYHELCEGGAAELQHYANFKFLLSDLDQGVMKKSNFYLRGCFSREEMSERLKQQDCLRELIKQYHPAYVADVNRREDVVASYKEQYDNLAALDQLFIAV